MGAIVFGYGNPSMGDDALGPLLLDRVGEWQTRNQSREVATVADFQLQIEHVLDMEGMDIALFLDASVACDPPFEFRPIEAGEDKSYTTHALSPAALLRVFGQTMEEEPPLCYLLAVRGERFELGDPLSGEASLNLEAAWIFLESLLTDPRPESWNAVTSPLKKVLSVR